MVGDGSGPGKKTLLVITTKERLRDPEKSLAGHAARAISGRSSTRAHPTPSPWVLSAIKIKNDVQTERQSKTIRPLAVSSKNEQDKTNNNWTTINNNTEERRNNAKSSNESKSVHFAHFSSVDQM